MCCGRTHTHTLSLSLTHTHTHTHTSSHTTHAVVAKPVAVGRVVERRAEALQVVAIWAAVTPQQLAACVALAAEVVLGLRAGNIDIVCLADAQLNR